MLSRCYQVVLLSLALNVLTDGAVFSLPPLPSPPYPVGQSSIGQPSQTQNVDEINAPYCYIQTTDGRVLNLEKLCGADSDEVRSIGQSSSPPSGQSSSPRSQTARTSSPFRLSSGWGYARDAEGR